MDRVTSITLRGKKIICMDISEFTTDAQIAPVLAATQAAVKGMGPKGALLLTDVTNAKYNLETAEMAKNFVKSNTPYMKASALIGLTGIHMILYQALIRISGRDIRLFNTRDEALTWLTGF